jgi:hypothetical protein
MNSRVATNEDGHMNAHRLSRALLAIPVLMDSGACSAKQETTANPAAASTAATAAN